MSRIIIYDNKNILIDDAERTKTIKKTERILRWHKKK